MRIVEDAMKSYEKIINDLVIEAMNTMDLSQLIASLNKQEGVNATRVSQLIDSHFKPKENNGN